MDDQIGRVNTLYGFKHYNQDALVNETSQLEELFDNFMQQVASRKALTEPTEDPMHEALNQQANKYHEVVFHLKNKTASLLRNSNNETKHLSVSQVSRQSNSSKDAIKMKSKAAGLEVENSVLIEIQKNEMLSETQRAQEEANATLLITKAK